MLILILTVLVLIAARIVMSFRNMYTVIKIGESQLIIYMHLFVSIPEKNDKCLY